MKKLISLVAAFLLLFLFPLNSSFGEGCGTNDECNDPEQTNIENGGNVGTNDPDDVNIENDGNEGTNE